MGQLDDHEHINVTIITRLLLLNWEILHYFEEKLVHLDILQDLPQSLFFSTSLILKNQRTNDDSQTTIDYIQFQQQTETHEESFVL